MKCAFCKASGGRYKPIRLRGTEDLWSFCRLCFARAQAHRVNREFDFYVDDGPGLCYTKILEVLRDKRLPVNSLPLGRDGMLVNIKNVKLDLIPRFTRPTEGQTNEEGWRMYRDTQGNECYERMFIV